jgi:hypothetical protein
MRRSARSVGRVSMVAVTVKQSTCRRHRADAIDPDWKSERWPLMPACALAGSDKLGISDREQSGSLEADPGDGVT